jgi:hypothetical protein
MNELRTIAPSGTSPSTALVPWCKFGRVPHQWRVIQRVEGSTGDPHAARVLCQCEACGALIWGWQ